MYSVPLRRLEKIVFCGEYVEYIRYCNPLNVEPRQHEIIKNVDEFTGKKDSNLLRARADIRRIIWTNQSKYTKFVTLTYANTVLDVDTVIYDFKQFIKKLRRRGYKCPYLWVMEHQKGRGQKEGNAGCLHVHCVIFNNEYIPYGVINQCWGKGNTDIHRIDDVKNLGAYVCKYLTKEEFDLYHKHSYHVSRDVKKPIVMNNDGYIGYYGENWQPIIDCIDFTYSGTCDYVYEKNGVMLTNTFLYQQGKFNQEKAKEYLYNATK